MSNIHLHAPNINTGGGLILLKYFLEKYGSNIKTAEFDIRSKNKLKIPSNIKYNFVKNSILSRILSEIRVFFFLSKNTKSYFFNGIPPLLPNRSNVTIIIQNRLLVDKEYIKCFGAKSKIRLMIESLVLKYCHKRKYNYVTPTTSMNDLLRAFLGEKTKTTIMPFIFNVDINEISTNSIRSSVGNEAIFLYVASGEPHKNHINLLNAWVMLKSEKITPTLVLTINSKQYPDLSKTIENYKKKHNLKIINQGEIEFEKVIDLYKKSTALIFPSFVESFGLPLVEAQQYSLPIIAPEKDYVRDVCNPIETFDPHSINSISRAVKRFLLIKDQTIISSKNNDFLLNVL